MRRIIYVASVLLSLIFIVGGAYILGATYYSLKSLDHLVLLHQIQLLRDRLFTDVHAVQAALKEKGTRFARGPDFLIDSVREMHNTTDACFSCHHSGAAQTKLVSLRDLGQRYERALSGVLTLRADEERVRTEEDMAFLVGDDLLHMLADLRQITTSHLEKRTLESRRLTNRAFLVLFLLVASGPILVITAGVLLVRSFGRPLTALLHATKKLEEGDLEYRVRGLKHEFKELGDSFNEMAGAVKEHMHQLQRTEQLAASGELATRIAHEIKNPLAAIRLSLQVLGEELDLEEEERKIFAKVQGEAGRIEKLMRDLLDYARPKQPKLVPLDVNRVLSKAGFGLEQLSSSKDPTKAVSLVQELDPHLPPVLGDPDQLLQVFINIVLNGIDVMPNGGELRIRSVPDGDFVQVEISDQGPGIPPELRAKIFEPFYTRKRGGTGLGLAISRGVVEHHGGTIHVAEAPTGGASFVVRLPVHSEAEV